MLTDTQESHIELINKFCADQLEYETSHRDAGDSYAHMPAESWCRESEKRMAEQFDEVLHYAGNLQWQVLHPAIDCKGLDLDQVSDLALDNFVMRRGSIYGMSGDESPWIILDSYSVQEIEIELDSLGLTYAEIMAVESDCEPYISGCGRAYLTTDAVWYAAIKRADLQALIDEATA